MYMKKIKDAETQLMANIAATLEQEYVVKREEVWKESPFEWLLKLPSRQRGKVGEQLVAGWAAARNFNVERSPDSDADKIIEGKRIEIKLSTLWENGVYTFQQLRNQDYEYLLCLGISPWVVHAWLMKKEEIPFDTLSHQHGGNRGNDTWWISFKADNPPVWIQKHGGTLYKIRQTMNKWRK
jgi:hypothetical protein